MHEVCFQDQTWRNITHNSSPLTSYSHIHSLLRVFVQLQLFSLYVMCPESIIKPKWNSCNCTSMSSPLLFDGSSVCKVKKKNTLIYVFISEWYSSIQEWRYKCNTIRLCVISVLKVLEGASPKQRYQHRNAGLVLLACSFILQLLERTVWQI